MAAPVQPLDIVSVAVAIAAAAFSPEIAGVVGPYAVIFIGALLGGAWSSSRLELPGRWGTLKYLAGIVILALLLTVPAAELATRYSEGLPFNYVLGPVAVLISALGPDGLRKCGRWLLRLKRLPDVVPLDPPNPPSPGSDR